ncbi:uncharacterized protein CDAR_119691 [Caerostris darwini]|uniref:Uncharacterized protein n=1 Tax=Caerostris darwini TaxID=1538125 RepID=A0AAV4V485_9ARAC|nr:uncharacterized protein CDAR_119691 [Caerostris darwini]
MTDANDVLNKGGFELRDWTFTLEIITKRTMLSIAHRLFDPFGVASSVMLRPKLMLQETWKMSLIEEIKGSLREEFIQWFNDLKALKQIYVPKWIKGTPETFDNCCLHVFCSKSRITPMIGTFSRCVMRKTG